MKQRRLRRPADEIAAADRRRRPAEDGGQLAPVMHRLEVEMLDRRAGDDEAVEALPGDLAPAPIERGDVAGRGGLRVMSVGHHQGQRDVDGSAAEQPGELRLGRSEEHTSELQSLMRISYAVFCLKKKNSQTQSI